MLHKLNSIPFWCPSKWLKRRPRPRLSPAARLALILGVVYAARPKTIREPCLDDIDFGNRRLTLASYSRPLDDLTRYLS